jgi:CheY-like chemotaxis protein
VSARIQGRRILIVEDEPLVAMMMTQLIKDLHGSVVGPYATIRDAAASLETAPDAALLDVNIGNDLAYPIAEELDRLGVPVVFVTGYQASSIDPRFAAAPVLTKPIEPDELAGALASVLRADAALARAGD